jgi:hypothetical protein
MTKTISFGLTWLCGGAIGGWRMRVK